MELPFLLLSLMIITGHNVTGQRKYNNVVGNQTIGATRMIVSQNAIVRSSSVWVNGSEGSNVNSIIDGFKFGPFESYCAMTYYEVEDAYFELDLVRATQVSQIDIYGLDLSEQNGAGNLQGAKLWFKKMVPRQMGPANMTVEHETTYASFTLAVDAALQYVVLQRSTTVRFAICEIVVWSTDILSVIASITMSSVRQDRSGDFWGPDLAVNEGEQQVGTSSRCKCCASTEAHTPDPWLQVDLGRGHRVSAVALYSRTDSVQDTLQHVYVYLDAYSEATGLPYEVIEKPITYVHLDLVPDHVTRYVTLVRKVTDLALTICEVRVFGRVCGNGRYGEGCKIPCGQCSGNVTCDVIDGHCEACKDGFFDEKCIYELISEGKTMESSTVVAHPNPGDLWNASRAVDGDNRTDPIMCECCAGTWATENPWMTLDLQGPYRIWQILVVGRASNTDDLLDLEIYLGESNSSIGSLVNAANNVTENNTVTMTFTPDVGARYVTLMLRGMLRTLVVCELQVFGHECPPYRYGPACKEECGHCLHGDSCSSIDGSCSECAPGFTGPTCKQDCFPGTFGRGCARSCGACSGGGACDYVTGACVTCKEGYFGTQCKFELVSKNMPVTLSSVRPEPSVYFWEASKAVDGDSRTVPSICQCCAATSNELSPWLQVDLDLPYKVARISVFGRTDDPETTLENLLIYLEPHSLHLTSPVYSETDNVTYIEEDLVPATPSDVITLMLGPERGMSALYICEVRVFAEDCDLGLFGPVCASICRCLYNQPCNGLTGQCPDGLCAVGWQGDSCSEECPHGLYGMNCSSLCGFCKDEQPCDKSTGYCLHGCNLLYTGLWCKQMLPAMSTAGTILGLTVGGLTILVTGLAVGAKKTWSYIKTRRRWGYQPPFEGIPDDWTATEVEIHRKQAEYSVDNELQSASKESVASVAISEDLAPEGVTFEVMEVVEKVVVTRETVSHKHRKKKRRRKHREPDGNGEHRRKHKKRHKSHHHRKTRKREHRGQ